MYKMKGLKDSSHQMAGELHLVWFFRVAGYRNIIVLHPSSILYCTMHILKTKRKEKTAIDKVKQKLTLSRLFIFRKMSLGREMYIEI